jgi:hypothetical protein
VVRHWSASLLVIKKSYLSGLDRPDERPSLPPFPHIRAAILKTSQPRAAKPTPQKSMTEATAFSFCFLHDAYDLSRQMANNELLRCD